jgi:hypothetical protein
MSSAGTKKGPLSVVQVGGDLNTNGDLEAFGLDGSGMLYHTYQHLTSGPEGTFNLWSSWYPLSSGFDVKQFAVGRNQGGSLAAVGVDSHGTVRYCSQETPGSTSWSGWTPIGSGHHISDLPSNLALVLDPDGYLELFAATEQGSVEHASQLSPGSSGWSDWTPLGVASGNIATLAAGQNWDGRLEVFGADHSGLVVHIAQLPGETGPGGAWSGSWTTLGSGYQMKKLAVARNVNGRLELFGTDGSGGLAHMLQQPKGGLTWTNWAALAPGYRVADFAVTVGADNRLTVCAALSDGSTETSNSIMIQQDSAGDETYGPPYFLIGPGGDKYKRISQIAFSEHSQPGPALAVYGVDEETQYALWILANEAVRDTVWQLLVENSGSEV